MNEAVAVKENVVAVLPMGKAEGEQELSRAVSAIELEAESIIIETDEDYRAAADFGRALKQKSAEVAAFFKPMKEAANRAHKEVCSREKVMLSPLQKAESILKQTMGTYALEQERKRKAQEAELRLQAQEEVERKMAEAIALDAQGDKAGAEAALLDAQMVDSVSRSSALAAEKPKADGVSLGIDYEIVGIDDEAVPVTLQGAVIRPVDKAAVMRLIRASKGKIAIPGITYKEVPKMTIRR